MTLSLPWWGIRIIEIKGFLYVMFLSSSIHTLDTKGRVSVPAEFRTLVAGEGFDGIMCWPSFEGPYLGRGWTGFDEAPCRDFLNPWILMMRPALLLSGLFLVQHVGCLLMPMGVFLFPKILRTMPGLKGKVAFVGLGARFEIWNPEAREEQVSKGQSSCFTV